MIITKCNLHSQSICKDNRSCYHEKTERSQSKETFFLWGNDRTKHNKNVKDGWYYKSNTSYLIILKTKRGLQVERLFKLNPNKATRFLVTQLWNINPNKAAQQRAKIWLHRPWFSIGSVMRWDFMECQSSFFQETR